MKTKALVCALAFVFAFLRLEAGTCVWSLPENWDASVSYTELNGRLSISGGDLRSSVDPVGAPDLPFLVCKEAFQKDAVIESVTIDAEWETMEGVSRPAINRVPRLLGEAPKAAKEDAQYFGAAAYPREAAEALTATLAGESALLLKVTPYRWNGVEGTLEKAKSLRVTVTYSVIKRPLNATSVKETIDMVVITPPAFTNLWPLYVEYRKTTHPDLNIIVKNTAEIYEEYASVGGDDAFKIHKYLEYLYKTHQLKYAILGAGCAKGTYNREKEIPTRYVYAINNMNISSDLYYSCMEIMNGGKEVWDYNGDGTYLAGESANQVDWTPEIACFRFPVRESAYVTGIKAKATRTYTAEQQVKGLIEKLKRVESADGNFQGNFKAGFSGQKTFNEDRYHGNTSDRIAGEHAFFDNGINLWSASHNSAIADWENWTRGIIRERIAANRPLVRTYHASSEGEAAQIYNNDLEINVHTSHGQDQTASPFEAYNFFTTSRIQKFLDFIYACRTGRFDISSYQYGNLCLGEAAILNPYGGALVTMNNTRETWSAGLDFENDDAPLIQSSMAEGLFKYSDGTAADAFLKGHARVFARIVAFASNLNKENYNAACYAIMNTMGDPLVRLAPAVTNVAYTTSVSGDSALTASITGSVTVASNDITIMNLSVSPETAGGEVTISGDKTLKVFSKLTSDASKITWNAPGGIGADGIEFTTAAKGDLTFEGTATRYVGTRFTNVGDVLLTGSGVTLDFDKTGKVRDLDSLSFVGGGTAENAIRCREGGIFAKNFTIGVTNAALRLETCNVGGVSDLRAEVPLFTLDNATLRIIENPHWATENLSRTVTMKDSTIKVDYKSVGFGPNVKDAGFTLKALSGTNEVTGDNTVSVLGAFEANVETNATLTIKTPLKNGNYAGSIEKTGAGTLALRASNTTTGGVVVKGGTLIAGQESASSLAAGAVTVEEGATLKLESIPSTSITRLTIKKGGKLILPGDVATSAYLLVDPTKAVLDFEEGALVYNENDLETPLEGSTTSNGYFMNTAGFLDWGGQDGNWSTNETDTTWLTQTKTATSYADGSSVQFFDATDAETMVVTVMGEINPGYNNFANRTTHYNFKKGNDAASLRFNELYLQGDTSFEPNVKSLSKTVVTAGKASFTNLTSGSISVAQDGALHLTGTLTSVPKISKIVFNATKFAGGDWAAFHLYYGCRVNELAFLSNGVRLALPLGTKVTASYTGSSSATETLTITGIDEDGSITNYTGSAELAKMFDGYAGTGWGYTYSGKSNQQTTPTMTVTIELGSPIEMFTSYRVAGADDATRCPTAWKVTVTESLTGKDIVVDTQNATAPACSYWTSGEVTFNGETDANLAVASGGTFYLDGTAKADVVLEDGARLAVTNNAALTVTKALTLEGSVVLDVSEAAEMGWTKVLLGANLATTDLSKFVVPNDTAATKILNGDLYVATKDVKTSPYARTITGETTWDTADWTANGTAFGSKWSEVATFSTAEATIDVAGTATLDIDTDVFLGTLKVVNTSGSAATLTVSGSSSLTVGTLDFSGYAGSVVWGPDITGANVICGTNDVTLSKGKGATLTVGAGGAAHITGVFSTYDCDVSGRVDFINTGRNFAVSSLPTTGILSFEGATVTGVFDSTDVTLLVEEGDDWTLVPTGDALSTPTVASIEITGGTLTVNPKGAAWHFGANGRTSFTMTDGTFVCTATGTDETGGLVIGCTEGSSYSVPVEITGGLFAVTNGVLNFYNEPVVSISDKGRMMARGIVGSGVSLSTLDILMGGTLEVGALGLATDAAETTLDGGLIAAYEDGVSLKGSLSIFDSGTIATPAGTTLKVCGHVLGEGTLTLGAADRTGTVSLAVVPEVETIVVAGGTWKLGSMRPTEKTLGESSGAISVMLTNTQIEEAMTTPIRIIKATKVPTGGVTVLTRKGAVVSDATVAIADGNLTIQTKSLSTEDDLGGDSMSVSVIGGNSDRPGRSITLGAAGLFPVAATNWNQVAEMSNKNAVNLALMSLKEVRADGSVGSRDISVTLSAACAFSADSSTAVPLNADAELLFGYLDDGGTGAKIEVSNIPYSQYDVYVYMGGDHNFTQFGPVTVTSGDTTTVYPAANTAWGEALSTTGMVTLVEGKNCFRVNHLTGSSLVVNGSTKGAPSGTRCGIAGIQIVNTGVRYADYTWRGGETGVWSFSDSNWMNNEDESLAAWPAGNAGASATIDTTAAITLSDDIYVLNLVAGASSNVVESITQAAGSSLTVTGVDDDSFVLGREGGSLVDYVVNGGTFLCESAPVVLGVEGEGALTFNGAGTYRVKGVKGAAGLSSLASTDESVTLNVGTAGVTVDSLVWKGTLATSADATLQTTGSAYFDGATLSPAQGTTLTVKSASALQGTSLAINGDVVVEPTVSLTGAITVQSGTLTLKKRNGAQAIEMAGGKLVTYVSLAEERALSGRYPIFKVSGSADASTILSAVSLFVSETGLTPEGDLSLEEGVVYYTPIGGTALNTLMTRTLPGTTTQTTFTYIYHPSGEEDNHTWETLSNWATAQVVDRTDGRIVTNYTAYAKSLAPGLPNSGAWDPILLDGVTVTASKLEGWTPRYGLYNGAQLTIGHLVKFQGGSQFIAVDETSSLTINGWGGKSESTHNFYVAAPSGIVFNVAFWASAANYYLGDKGSVAYAKGFTGTHTIKSVTIDLGQETLAEKGIVEKKYLIYGSGTATTAGATVTGGRTAKDSAVTEDDAVGTYFFGSDETGTYIEWVAYGEGPVVLQKQLTYPLPVTGEVKSYAYTYHPSGEDDNKWDTATNWATVIVARNLDGTIVTNYTTYTKTLAPGIRSSGVYSTILLDGVTATASQVEGWTPQYGLYHHANVTIDSFFKFQGGSQFIAVDETSSLTIKSLGGGAWQQTMNFYVAAPSGIVFKTAYGKATPINYYLGGEGSICFENGFSGTHTLQVATIELGDNTLPDRIVKRKYLVIGSGTLVTSGATVEGGTLKSSAVAETDAVGTYYIAKDSTGWYIEWVAYSEKPKGVFYTDPDSGTTYEITSAFTNATDGTWLLDGTKSVTFTNPSGVKETVTVAPAYSTIEEDADVATLPFVIDDNGNPVLGVKTIPGLTYGLYRATTLGAFDETPIVKAKANGDRVKLKDENPPTDKAFYRVRVSYE